MADVKNTENTLPHNTDAESNLLGSLMLGGGPIANIVDKLRPEDFYLSRHQIIFEELQALYAAEGVTDPVILIDRLESSGLLDKVGGSEYVIELTTRVRTSSNALEYANIIEQAALRRRVVELCQDLESRARTGSGNINDIVDEAGARVLNLSKDEGKSVFHSIQESLDEGFRLLDQLEKGQHGNIMTGFSDLDEMTNGLHPQDLVILAGRPGMGKTTFALNIACNAVSPADHKPVLIFSLEMSHDQLALRMLSATSGVNATRLLKGQLNDQEWKDLMEASDKLKAVQIITDDSPELNVMAIRSRARRLHQRHPLGLVVVDYLQLLEMGGRVENRQQEITQISRSLKQLARELNVPVIAISQLSRAVEQREGHRPRMADLRESGSIEQDADLIMLIYREEVYYPDKEEAKGIAEINIAKQRKGAVGTVKLAFQPDRLRFVDLSYADPVGQGHDPF
ncbi:MAG: replicative DNA helicase [Planctomycetota bacterium]